jgi:hypothetical protein
LVILVAVFGDGCFERLREIEAREPRVTLLYSVRDPVHNHAAAVARRRRISAAKPASTLRITIGSARPSSPSRWGASARRTTIPAMLSRPVTHAVIHARCRK